MVLHARADSAYVRSYLLPQLRACGLHVATLADMLEPGVDELVSVERSLAGSRRVIAVASAAFGDAQEGYGALEHLALSQRKGLDLRAGRFSIIPAYLEDPQRAKSLLPEWLGSLVGVELSGYRAAEGMKRLVRALGAPVVPTR